MYRVSTCGVVRVRVANGMYDGCGGRGLGRKGWQWRLESGESRKVGSDGIRLEG